jgi:hypothetical protein
MCWIYEHPSCLLRLVLSEWLDVTDVGKLDSATCSCDRASYLNMVKDDVTISGKEILNQVTKWVLKRGIALTWVTVNQAFGESTSDRVKYLKIKGRSVRGIKTSNTDLGQFWDSVVRELCEFCPAVTFLEWSGPLGHGTTCMMIGAWSGLLTHITLKANITGAELIEIGGTCHMLVDLDVGCSDSAAWSQFFLVCSRTLQSIFECQQFDDSICEAVALRCSQLRKLTGLSGKITDVALKRFGELCPLLESVCFESYFLLLPRSQITDASIVAIAVSGALTELALQRCDNVTDRGMQAVARHCPRLKRLVLDDCQGVTDYTLKMIGQHCNALHTLDVSRCYYITHVGLAAVASGCLRLEELHISNNMHLGAGVAHIARGCPCLRVFFAYDVPLSEEAVQTLARHCPRLTHVGVEGREVGNAAICQLAQGCPELTSLYIFFTSVSKRGLLAIKKHCKKLREIELDRSKYPSDPFYYRKGVNVNLHRDPRESFAHSECVVS